MGILVYTAWQKYTDNRNLCLASEVGEVLWDRALYLSDMKLLIYRGR